MPEPILLLKTFGFFFDLLRREIFVLKEGDKVALKGLRRDLFHLIDE